MLCSFARRYSALAVLALSALSADLVFAVPAGETLFPATTKGMISVPDVYRLEENWNKTQIGQMTLDPVMQPFVEDFKRQFKEKWTDLSEKLGLTLEDLEGIPGGEVTVGLIQPGKNMASLAVVVDVTGKAAEAAELMTKIDKNMTAKKATKAITTVKGAKVTTYTLLKKPGEKVARQAVFFTHNDVFSASDSSATTAGILSRMDGTATDNMANLPAYKAVMNRVAQSAGPQVPEIRWFVEPFGYTEASRIINPPKEKKKGKDLLKILSEQGFQEAIQGLGGYIHFYVDAKYEVIHRTAVHAPAVKGAKGDEKYHLAARMLRFPNGGKLDPQTWIPRELSTYASLNIEIARAFEYSSTLVDAYIGEPGTFEDVIRGLIEDPHGPKIDLRKDIVAHLGQRCTVITDSSLPVTPKSERIVIAVESINPAELAKAIEKVMKADPDVRKVVVKGHTVWEIVQEDDENLPNLDIDSGFDPTGANGFDPTGGGAGEEEPRRKLPNSAVTVARGQLLVATHIDFLEKVLVDFEPHETLSTNVDYIRVMDEMDALFGATRSGRFFSRTEEEFRPTYELIRAGKMPESESVLGKLLNTLLGTGEEGEVRKQKIDGSQLPDFETVRRYFGPAGGELVSEDDGWFMLGVLLSRQLPHAVKANDRELR